MPQDKQPQLPVILQNVAKARRAAPSWKGDSVQVIDPATDLAWSIQQRQTQAPHNYFDYYFTGQDVKIFMDGVDNQEDGMPILEFAWSIQQQKTPVFGFWSHTYDAVMRGTRIVNGAVRVATMSPNYMRDMVAAAAKARADQNAVYPIRSLDDDEKNIEKYWTKTIDPSIAANQNKQLFSSHPPFNFVIIYGLQSTSLTESPNPRFQEVFSRFKEPVGSEALYTNVNERLVESDPAEYKNRWVMEAVELTGVQTEYTGDGAVTSETYSFFARDCYTP